MATKKKSIINHKKFYTLEEAACFEEFPLKGKNLKLYLQEQQLKSNKEEVTIRWRLNKIGGTNVWELRAWRKKKQNEFVS